MKRKDSSDCIIDFNITDQFHEFRNYVLFLLNIIFLPKVCLSSHPAAQMYVRSLLKSQAQTPRSKNPFPNRANKPAGSSED